MRVCCHISHVPLFATLWTVAHKAPLSIKGNWPHLNLILGTPSNFAFLG